MVNIHLLSIPVLFKLQGASAYYHPFVYAENADTFRARPGRTNLVLGSLQNGRFYVTRNNKYGSGMLTPLMESNAIALLGEERGGAKAGEVIRVVLMGAVAMAETNAVTNE
jgi:molybdopterin molybdotransferase